MNVIESPEIDRDFIYLFNNKGIAELHVQSIYRWYFIIEPDFNKALKMCENLAISRVMNVEWKFKIKEIQMLNTQWFEERKRRLPIPR